ncbi:MAG: hypothetical protein ACI84O_000103, partial [Myxococcota bacterium]
MSNTRLGNRTWPWIEGLILALLVLIVVSMGGESVRSSYHGLLHTTIGESVLREGLLPENPYHAGEQLNYYTLYPTLGVLLGRLGGGSLWGFALINIIAALLMGPALDSLGQRLKFGFAARRSAFWCMLLGFNFMGFWLAYGVAVPPLGALPMFILEPATNFYDLFSWDARLQSFVAKFFNVSSFACALPVMLFALSNAIVDTAKSRVLAAILLGVCVALNPLVGAFSALLIVAQAVIRVGPAAQQLLTWAKLGSISLLIALPFVLPLLMNSGGEDIVKNKLPFVGDGALLNIIGPCMLLIVMNAIVLPRLLAEQRKVLLLAIGLAVIFSFANLPFGNEYKFPRLLAIFLALPAGQFVVWFANKWPKKIFIAALAALAMPMTFTSVRAYAYWNVSESLSLTTSDNGVLVPRTKEDGTSVALPIEIIEAIKALPQEAVLMMHPRHPGAGSMGLGSQGNQWAPVLSRSLFVDKPQIHNLS